MNKYKDFSWDFVDHDTKEFTHIFHTYPAMMIPQIARRLIEKYSNKNTKLIFDPYMGSGTTLVEAMLKGINVIGTDLNPLARLIGSAKTNLVDIRELHNKILIFENYILDIIDDFENIDVELFNFDIRDSWFKIKNSKELTIIKNWIENLEDDKIKEFFLVSFTEIVRNVSLTRNGEFKLYKIAEEKREQFNPNAFSLMTQKLFENYENYIKFHNFIFNNNLNSTVKIYDFNTSISIPDNIISDESIDLIITSPPYGDSKTTVAYGQFSRLANEWLKYDSALKVDSHLMGGNTDKEITFFNFKPLDDIINQLQQNDYAKNLNKSKTVGKSKRALEVSTFYKDYRNSINNISVKVKHNGIVAYVVGNRRVHDIELPTDEITKFFFEQNGFTHIETIVRNIPNKRMPSKTSPSNKTGEKVSTMNFEYIVVLKK